MDELFVFLEGLYQAGKVSQVNLIEHSFQIKQHTYHILEHHHRFLIQWRNQPVCYFETPQQLVCFINGVNAC